MRSSKQRATTSADFLNASPNEIVFGANMTTLTFHLARALGREYRAGRRNCRHRAGPSRKCRAVARARKRAWRQSAHGENDSGNGPARLGRFCRATQRAHEAGRDRRGFERARHDQRHVRARSKWRIRSARRSSSMRCITRRTNWSTCARWDCDFLGCSAYKFYGPHIGILWGRQELLESLDFPKLIPAPRYRAGTRRDRHAKP